MDKGCLANKGRYVSATKEKAWTNYHKAVLVNHSDLTSVTKNSKFTGWICLQVFKTLIEYFYHSPTLSDDVKDVKDEEKQIVKHVGGAVVKKLNQRVVRLTDSKYKFDKFQCLDALCCEKTVDDEKDMTAAIDLGGLTYLKPNIKCMFISIEEVFRACQNKESVFVRKCVENESVSTFLYDTVYSFDISKDVLDDTFDNILCLYFKIRIHHRLNQVMDKVNSEWCAKSLRKQLSKK